MVFTGLTYIYFAALFEDGFHGYKECKQQGLLKFWFTVKRKHPCFVSFSFQLCTWMDFNSGGEKNDKKKRKLLEVSKELCKI